MCARKREPVFCYFFFIFVNSILLFCRRAHLNEHTHKNVYIFVCATCTRSTLNNKLWAQMSVLLTIAISSYRQMNYGVAIGCFSTSSYLSLCVARTHTHKRYTQMILDHRGFSSFSSYCAISKIVKWIHLNIICFSSSNQWIFFIFGFNHLSDHTGPTLSRICKCVYIICAFNGFIIAPYQIKDQRSLKWNFATKNQIFD